MAYIVVLNPLILGGSEDVAGGSLDFAQLTAVTGLVAGVITILFGVVARLPFGLAAGLGMNSFLAVSVVQEVTWADAMGLVIINGVIIVVLGATGIRTAIFNAVPHALKIAITVGIGLFIAFIGFVNSGFVTRTPSGPPVQLGQDGSIASLPTLVFVFALVLIGILVARQRPRGHPHRHHRRHDRSRSSSRRSRSSAPSAIRTTRTRWAGTSRLRRSPSRSSPPPTSVSSGPSTSSAASSTSASSRPRCSSSPSCSRTSSTLWDP
jgi:vacuolar-type H+-ATPase subunit I/STV1